MTQPETPSRRPSRAARTRAPSAARPAAPEVRVQLFGRTDVGQVREHNEDNFLVADLTRRPRGLMEADRATVVGERGARLRRLRRDGRRGRRRGREPARGRHHLRAHGRRPRRPPANRDELARAPGPRDRGRGPAHLQRGEGSTASRRGMGTTVTVAALVDDLLFFGQVGDSRAATSCAATRSCRSRATSRS